MIGSQRKVKMVFDELQKDGVTEEALAAVHAPIGLDIHAETPEEIALSIMAEIVMVRRGGQGGLMRLRGG
jgi:xanthine dehydrogenase accessory factor